MSVKIGDNGLPAVFTIEDKRPRKPAEDAVAFEDALDLAGMGCYNYTLYAVCSLTVLSMALETFGTSYVVTASACDLQLSTATRGLVSAMPMLGIVVSSHLWGWAADTRGRRATLLASMGGSAASALACSLSPSWPYVAFFKFLAAFFASASNGVTYALFGESTPRAHRDRLVMLMSSGLMFAQGVMSLNAYPILSWGFDLPMFWGLHYRPWRLLELCYGAWCGLSALLLLLLVKESPKFLASRGQEADSLRVLSEMYARNTGRRKEDYPVKSLSFLETTASSKDSGFLRSMWEQTTPLFRAPLLKDTLVITYIVIVVYAISPAFLMWMPTITDAFSRAVATGAKDRTFCQLLHLPKDPSQGNGTDTTPVCIDKVEDLTFITMFLFSSAMALVNLLNSQIIRFVGKRFLVIFLHVLGGVCGILLPWISDTYASLAVFFLFQSNLIAMGLTTGFTVEVYPTYLRAMAVCLTMMIGRGSSFITISYVGVLLENHCDATFYAFGAIVLSGAVVGLFLPSERKVSTKKVEDGTNL